MCLQEGVGFEMRAARGASSALHVDEPQLCPEAHPSEGRVPHLLHHRCWSLLPPPAPKLRDPGVSRGWGREGKEAGSGAGGSPLLPGPSRRRGPTSSGGGGREAAPVGGSCRARLGGGGDSAPRQHGRLSLQPPGREQVHLHPRYGKAGARPSGRGSKHPGGEGGKPRGRSRAGHRAGLRWLGEAKCPSGFEQAVF